MLRHFVDHPPTNHLSKSPDGAKQEHKNEMYASFSRLRGVETNKRGKWTHWTPFEKVIEVVSVARFGAKYVFDKLIILKSRQFINQKKNLIFGYDFRVSQFSKLNSTFLKCQNSNFVQIQWVKCSIFINLRLWKLS